MTMEEGTVCQGQGQGSGEAAVTFTLGTGPNTPTRVEIVGGEDADSSSRETLLATPHFQQLFDNGDESSRSSASCKTKFQGLREIRTDLSKIVVAPENLFQYEWPPNSGEKFFLQEQLVEYIQVTSFKRKYPDLSRRPVEPNEKRMLQEKSVIPDTQLEGPMSALRSIEVVNLLRRDFPQEYEAYEKAVNQRVRKELDEKQKEMMTIVQGPSNRWFKAQTRPGAYPVALFPGQFTDGPAKRFTSGHLKKLPLEKATDVDGLLAKERRKRPASPPSIVINNDELEAASSRVALRRGGEKECSVCRRGEMEERSLFCSKCTTTTHQSCLEMSDALFDTASKYDWTCLDCKPCSLCDSVQHEEKMMFCDRCDRGYHTFCVGLSQLPSGPWVCGRFCGGGQQTATSGQPSRRKQSLIPPGTKCNDCSVFITKENKVHHLSKGRHLGVCRDCLRIRQR